MHKIIVIVAPMIGIKSKMAARTPNNIAESIFISSSGIIKQMPIPTVTILCAIT